MMSVEKFIALYFPFKSRNICTVRTAKWASGIAFVLFIPLNLFWFFVVKEHEGDFGARYLFCTFEDFFIKYFPIYNTIDGILSMEIQGQLKYLMLVKLLKAYTQ